MKREQRRLANRLKQLRKKKGDSLRRVEEATGISNGLLCQYETGHVNSPTIWNLLKLSQHYGISLNDLLKP